MALYAFDGTWNEEKDSGVYGINTNVVEFARAYRGKSEKLARKKEEMSEELPAGTSQDDFYVGGVGVRHGIFGKFFGGAFGVGGRTRIREAKDAVERNFAAGDEDVDIVGFSRGAALALHFSNVVGGMKVKRRDGSTVSPMVRFLGIWDVVAAFGVPIDIGPFDFQRINLGYKLSLPKHVQYCFHAMALDERRKAFRVTRVQNAYEVWFRGVHSDVGGGNQNSPLSNIALAWMLRKAQIVGLPVDPSVTGRLTFGAEAAVKPSKLAADNPFRKLSDGDRFHHSISRRSVPECQNPPENCALETADDERRRALTVQEIEAQRSGVATA